MKVKRIIKKVEMVRLGNTQIKSSKLNETKASFMLTLKTLMEICHKKNFFLNFQQLLKNVRNL